MTSFGAVGAVGHSNAGNAEYETIMLTTEWRKTELNDIGIYADFS
jgi:hypothetical protein